MFFINGKGWSAPGLADTQKYIYMETDMLYIYVCVCVWYVCIWKALMDIYVCVYMHMCVSIYYIYLYLQKTRQNAVPTFFIKVLGIGVSI